jgi:hypothetical protein
MSAARCASPALPVVNSRMKTLWSCGAKIAPTNRNAAQRVSTLRRWRTTVSPRLRNAESKTCSLSRGCPRLVAPFLRSKVGPGPRRHIGGIAGSAVGGIT